MCVCEGGGERKKHKQSTEVRNYWYHFDILMFFISAQLSLRSHFFFLSLVLLHIWFHLPCQSLVLPELCLLKV